ncbi:MAG TPA: c-type cytochrome [Opitutaceae bacterium]|nr:c-type cytochrome [Opitutaceae bacterium]
MRYVYLFTAFACVLVVSLFGFRGARFTSPPIDVFPEWAFPGMKRQPKYKPQAPSPFFADGRADRPVPEHTVSRDDLRADDQLYRGKDAAGAWARGFPAALTIDAKFMEHGRERYTIYCSPCHSAIGDGNGVTKRYGLLPATFLDDRLRQMSEGEIFNTITNGSQNKNMMPYADKLAPEERWAVIAYIRALQRAEGGKASDVVDATERKKLGLP